MSISFAGVVLRTDNAYGELTSWMDRLMPLRETSFLSPRPDTPDFFPAGAGLANGFPRMNWPDRPPRRLNSLWWPQGASRWAEYYAVCQLSELQQILYVVQGPRKTQNIAAQLVLSDIRYQGPTPENEYSIDANSHIRLSTEMYLLQPRALSNPPSGEGFWLLPLVDERYLWQYRLADCTEINFEESESNDAHTLWESVLDEIGSGVDIGGIDRSTFSQYLPAPLESLFKRTWPLSVMLEGAALSIGQRVVRGIDRVVKTINSVDSLTNYQKNFTGEYPFGRWLPLGGADVSSFHRQGGQMKTVAFVYSEDDPDTTTEVNPQALGSEESKIIFAPSNLEEADRANYEEVVATEYWAWREKSFDYVFATIKAWEPTGFDDGIEYRMDWDRWAVEDHTVETDGLGSYCFWSRVQSLPHNCEIQVIGEGSECADRNEVQMITILGLPTGGNFSLVLTLYNDDGDPVEETITDILWNSTDDQLKTRLESHSEAEADDFLVTGGPFPGNEMRIEFVENLAARDFPKMLAASMNTLTGGTGVGVIISVDVQGFPN